MSIVNKPELLSPAGNLEKLRSAVLYGADAVYLAGKRFGMRAAADNFTDEEMCEGISHAHSKGVKVYVTLNVMPRTGEYEALRKYVTFLADAGADAVIVSDPGVMELVRETAPTMEIHVSTQASAVSAQAVRAWSRFGATRVVLARELTLSEISEIHRAVPEIELECFIHGSMCVAYSGRCLLSQYFVGRDANRGMCAQPCRWEYRTDSGDRNVRTLDFHEVKRPDKILTAEEHDEGTFIMSSKDLCMIGHIPELMESGIASFKIEGRMKSAYYTAAVTNAYRLAIDAYMADPSGYKFDPAYLRELECVSHREYDTGFFFDRPMDDAKITEMPGYIREKSYIATALEDSEPGECCLFVQRNKVSTGDGCELLSPGKVGVGFTANELYSEKMEPIESAPHPGMKFYVRVPYSVKTGDIIRGAQ